MEEQTPQPPDSEHLSAKSATALRDLEERARAALAASREQVSRLEGEITGRLEAIAATLAAEHADHTSQDEWNSRLAEFEQKLAEKQAAWNEQRSQWENERSALEHERNELRQKFDLALEDLQRFRGRAAELEQELSRRPETGDTDSAELVALRAERDALSERVEELERRPASPTDADAEQQMADLQRRFELAVEDVRELKTKNAQLESRLAAAKHKGSAPESGGMDWESQKRRLLASLEGGEGDSDPARQKERATIEGTIEMTDAVIAEKDREIAELKSQLAAGGGPLAAGDAERNRKVEELLDADAVICEHRERIAQLEREIEDKLRAAELEVSVERAKIARQKAELEQWRAELESQRGEVNASGGGGRPGVPRRRWLSKLGLSGEDS